MRNVIVTICLAAALPACAAPPAPGGVVTADGWSRAIARAQPGQTLKLSGAFPALDIKGRNWSPSVTIDATDATIDSLNIEDSSGVTLVGGVYEPSAPRPAKAAVQANRSSRIVFQSVKVRNAAPGDGIAFAASQDTEIRNSSVDGARNCSGIFTSTGVTVSGLEVKGCRIDGLDIWYSHQVTVEKLSCSDFNLVDKHHPDCVQLLSRKDDTPTSDITIRDSIAVGAMQGFSGFDHGTGGYDRVRIINNTARVTYATGVRLMACRQCEVSGNKVETLDGAQFRANIVTDGDTVRCGNVIAAGAGKPGQNDPRCRR